MSTGLYIFHVHSPFNESGYGPVEAQVLNILGPRLWAITDLDIIWHQLHDVQYIYQGFIQDFLLGGGT